LIYGILKLGGDMITETKESKNLFEKQEEQPSDIKLFNKVWLEEMKHLTEDEEYLKEISKQIS
jgi:hypothetical protein